MDLQLYFDKSYPGEQSQIAIIKGSQLVCYEAINGFSDDHLVNVYSLSKLIVSMAIIILAHDGKIKLTDTIAHYWPEFAENNKENITVAHVLSQQSGLPHFEAQITTEDTYDWNKIINLLSQQSSLFPAGTQTAYQARTYGFILGEVIQRITGEALPDAIDKIMPWCKGKCYFGVPGNQRQWILALKTPTSIIEAQPDSIRVTGKYTKTVFSNPSNHILFPNQKQWQKAIIPSSGCHTNAIYLVKIIWEFLNYGNGSMQCYLLNNILTGQKNFDETLGFSCLWYYGFLGNQGEFGKSANVRFGYRAVGGSIAFIDLSAELIFCYTTNLMLPQIGQYPAHDSRIIQFIDSI